MHSDRRGETLVIAGSVVEYQEWQARSGVEKAAMLQKEYQLYGERNVVIALVGRYWEHPIYEFALGRADGFGLTFRVDSR